VAAGVVDKTERKGEELVRLKGVMPVLPFDVNPETGNKGGRVWARRELGWE